MKNENKQITFYQIRYRESRYNSDSPVLYEGLKEDVMC